MAALSVGALAGPEGGEVVEGDVTITNPTTTTTQIDQTSDRGIINWQSFDIGSNEAAVFNQPNSTSVTLNRIFDENPSVIAGLLTANGRIILINANGMVFENGASVNTAGLIATSADIANQDFMAGNYRFETPGAANASIVNKGLITVEEGGVVAFVAPHVRNAGVITAKLGRVGLGAGDTFVLDLYGDSLISFPVSAEIARELVGPDGQPLSALVEAGGRIDAGTVQLTARAARGLIDNVINVDGEIIASGVAPTDGGVALTGTSNNEIQLGGNGVYGRYGDAIVVDGGENGVAVAGRLDASSATGQGGNVTITGRSVALTGATVDASGATGGGHIKVGYTGDTRSIGADTIYVSRDSTLKADAIEEGDGGSVVFWSKDATAMHGAISAKGGASSGDGGFLEVSSKGEVGFSGSADASAANGTAGLLTLDPKNIIVSTAGGASNQFGFGQLPTSTLTVNPDSVTATLNTGTAVSLQANNDLTIASDIIVNRNFGDGGALTLQAGRSVFINAQIFTDDGNLTVIANEVLAAGVIDAQRDPGNAVLSMGVGGSIDAGAGQVRLTLASGAGKTNTASGDITLRDIDADRIIVENLGPSNGDVVIAAGATLTGTSTGTAIVLAAQGGDFINNAGANALQATNGRWVVYSTTPLANTLGGLDGTPYYNMPYNPANPTDFPADGNRFAYSINPVITVAADDQSRDYGDFNPELTYTITGFIAGDDPNLALEGEPFVSTPANEQSDAGTYAINVGLQTLASDYNYTIVTQDAVLTVVPAQLYYEAFGDSREYGEPNNALFGNIVGFRLNDTAGDVVTGTLTFTTAADETADAGFHAIDGSGLTVINSNYQLTILQDPGNATALEITPAQLTYIADFTLREYGDPNVLTGVVDGLKNGDLLEDVTDGVLTWTSSADETSPLGFYEIVGGGLTLTTGNYVATILQDPNNAFALQVTPAQLYYVADAKSKTYGELNPTFTGAIQGLKNGDALEDVTDGTLVWVSQALDESGAGIYGIFGDGLVVTSGNYFIDILQADANESAFTVNQAQLTFVADRQSRIYGFPDPEFTGQVLGLTNGDSLDDAVIGDLVFTTPATSTSLAGFYAINGGGVTVSSPNYVSTVLQDPGNATAFRIIGIPLTTVQAQEESANGNESAVDQEQNDMASRSNELGIVGVAPVSVDMDDGSNDQLAGQLCVLSAPQSADIPGCLKPSQGP